MFEVALSCDGSYEVSHGFPGHNLTTDTNRTFETDELEIELPDESLGSDADEVEEAEEDEENEDSEDDSED